MSVQETLFENPTIFWGLMLAYFENGHYGQYVWRKNFSIFKLLNAFHCTMILITTYIQEDKTSSRIFAKMMFSYTFCITHFYFTIFWLSPYENVYLVGKEMAFHYMASLKPLKCKINGLKLMQLVGKRTNVFVFVPNILLNPTSNMTI